MTKDLHGLTQVSTSSRSLNKAKIYLILLEVEEYSLRKKNLVKRKDLSSRQQEMLFI
jgi:hypothetical protein